MATLKLLPLCAALLLASACSQQPVRATPQLAAAVPVPVAATENGHAVVEDMGDAKLPKQALTSEILFKFLLAEVAGQRGEIGLARSTYIDLARRTGDPRIARRAAEVALFARDDAAALEATRLWAAGEQGSARAQQTLAALLLSEGNLAEAEPILRELLKADTANRFLHLTALMGKMRDPVAALQLVERLAADYPELPEARFAVAQIAAAGGRFDAATSALEQAERLRPGWEPAALLRAQILAKNAPEEALAYLRGFLAAYPNAREARLAYARALVNANQFAEARAEFTRLTKDFPGNAEVSFAAGLLSLQMGDLAAARDFLSRTLDYSPRDPDTVHYYLGQVAEQTKQFDAAAAHYAAVAGGNYLVPARARQAALLARSGKMAEARALLASTEGGDDAQNVRLVQAQSELLRDNKEHGAAFEVLSEGIKRFPDAAELLYDRAMVAEKLDRLEVLEADLRRVIVLRPDDAQAYNALGYTLADRNDRLPEAVQLLEKALSLAPEDPFILDSAGWAQFRAGNLARAQEFLERAYKVRQDPEIAAHLGEVLWARGQRDAAGKLWQSTLHSHPQNEVLLETLRRLKP
jgi:tetratricopeptide (TPR) repeat protein